MNEDIKEELEYQEEKVASLEKDIAKVEAELNLWKNRIITGEGISSDEDLDLAMYEVRKCLYAIKGMEELRASIEMQIKLLKG
jgi:hypothetical protein